MSPFAKEARAKFYDYIGGKVDDITVMVAQVKIEDDDEKEKDDKSEGIEN